MAATPKAIVEHLRQIETDMVDQRNVTELELRALVWFFEYGQNVFSQSGRDWRGATFRQDATTCLLVTKSEIHGIRQVAFITDRTPISCVVAFCKKWHADRVEWYDDKYV